MTLRELIKDEEALRLKVYDDATGKGIVPGSVVVGHPTIGWGCALDVEGIDEEEADYLFERRLTKAINRAAEVVGRDVFGSLNPARQAALTSMAFQMGRAGLEGFNRMLLNVRSGDWQNAHDNALDSKWARQTPERARRIATMLLTGEW